MFHIIVKKKIVKSTMRDKSALKCYLAKIYFKAHYLFEILKKKKKESCHNM